MTAADQTRALMAMMLCGAGTGVLHDLLAVFRKKPALTAAADLLLGIACACGVVTAGLALRFDPFRLYALVGVGLGWALYAVSVRMGVRIFAACLIRLSKNVFYWAKTGKFMQENTKMKRI